MTHTIRFEDDTRLRIASLDPDEKSDQKRNPRALERRWKHGRDPKDLSAWDDAIVHCGLSPATTHRILSCGTNAWVEHSPSTGRYRVRADACNHRMCPLCRYRYAKEKRATLTNALRRIKPGNARMCTLTQVSSDAPLKVQIANLWTAYRRLRARSFWKKRVRGSIAVLEITYNEVTKQWHPHLHAILNGRYLDQRALAKEWLHSTRSSRIVDIRLIKNTDRTADYLTSYLTKPPRFPTTTRKELTVELITATSRIRLVRCHGTLRNLPDEEPAQDDYPDDWITVKPLLVLIDEALHGHHDAITILRTLRANGRDSP